MKLQQTKIRLFSLATAAILSCAAVSQGVTVICCAGNSVTMTAQYPEAMQVLLGSSYKVYNEGVGGSGITGWSLRYITTGTPGFADIMNIKPNIITIKLGVNDCHGDSESLAQGYVQGYDSLIDAFLTIVPKPQIYLILPAPMFPPEQQNWGDNLQCMIVPLVKHVAAQYNLPVVDFNTPFLNGPAYFPNSVHADAGSPAADTMTQVLYRAITGVTTPKPQPPQFNEINAIVYGNGRFVAVDNMGTISTSPDGTTWTRQYDDSVYPLHSVAYGNNQFVAAGWTGRMVGSTDGTTWTAKNSPTKEPFFSVTYASGKFMAAGGFGNGLTFTSTDGASWSSSVGTNTSTVTSVTFGNGSFVTVSNYGQISKSSNGTTWDTVSSGTGSWLTSVVYAGNQFVAVGQNGTILTSTDGTSWTKRTSGTTNWLWSVAYGNNEFVAVGSVGTILTSTDGTTWTTRNSGTTKYLTSVTYGSNKFVIGGYGIMLTMNGDAVGVASRSEQSAKSLRAMTISCARNSVCVVVPDRLADRDLKARLFNTAGRQIYCSDITAHSGRFSLPTSGIPAGKYFISIVDGNATTLSSEFVLTK